MVLANKKLNFDWLHFTDSDIEVIRLHEDELELLVINLLAFDVEKQVIVDEYEKLYFKFIGVGKSVRHIIPYASGRYVNKFLPPVDICDIDNGLPSKERFELEGVLVEPLSWIGSWVIECERVEVCNVDDLNLEVV